MPASSASKRPARPFLQFSLQGLLVVTAMVAMGLGFYRLAGPQALVHYAFLIFAVGPWFAWLASECLPIHTPQLRTAAANMILLLLFIVVLKLAEATMEGPVAIVVGIAALFLWTPQYMLFFVWRVGERT